MSYFSYFSLYALRALLCAQWIVDEETVPPVEFSQLQCRYIKVSPIAEQLTVLLEAKADSSEGDKIIISDDLMSFAKSLFAQLMEAEVSALRETAIEAYDAVLLDILDS